ncbi:MAG: hypothetical protein ABWY82_27070 [Tardiphaga sp.]|jgi:hypothetical protein
MKRQLGVLLSSTAAVTTVLGASVAAATAPSADERPPIERLNSIRDAYLAALAGETAWDMPVADKIAQFKNFPNFPNFSNWRNR